MKKFLHLRDGASKGAALIIVLALVVIASALGLAYFSRTTTDRKLAQSSFNDTTADLVARSALDITVSDLKQEILANEPVTAGNIQPARYPAGIPNDNPNLIRYSSRNAAESRASTVISTAPSANGRSISLARWNSHYLIPRATPGPGQNWNTIYSDPVPSFTAPDWVLVTGQGPLPAPAPNTVIGRYAFAVYDEGGLVNMNLGGFPNYASLTLPGRPNRPSRKPAAKYPAEESEIMLAAFTPNDPNPSPCHGQNDAPSFTPDHTNAVLSTGVPCSLLFNTNQHPDSFGVLGNWLPHGLSINTTNGNITGTPSDPGSWTVTLTATNQCGTGTAILNFTIAGFPSPDSTPWAVNLARKGTIAFADLTTLPSTPTAITPTTPVGSMGGFLDFTSINKLMGWRNYATTQQPGAFFPNSNPWFPPGPAPTATPTADLYARYFLGAIPPFRTPYTTVSTAVVNNRTDQGLMTRQELIRLQRTIGFSQSLLQYLGTFSREYNRPAGSWPQLSGSTLSGARWDMNNLAMMVPMSWWPGHHGQGHGYGYARRNDVAQLFGLVWVDGTYAAGTRMTDPNYYGHWRYTGKLRASGGQPLEGADPDFFQVIDYAMNQAIGVNDPNHMRNTFNIGAALVDLYDGDDVFDVPPGGGNPTTGNIITIIDYDGEPANYAYGIEAMSFDDPSVNTNRAWFAPNPLSLGVPLDYVLLNRRFENVGEFGYAYSPVSTTPSKTLDFASSTSNDKALLDFFTYNSAAVREGTVNLNTRNGPVLASIIRGAWLHDPGYEVLPPDSTYLVSQDDALAAGQAIVQETTNTAAGRGPALTRADVARLAGVAASALHGVAGASADETKQTIARALAEVGQARTWNLMIDVIAQTGRYSPGTTPPLDNSNANKFIAEGEKRYWLHVALDRDDGTVLGTQLEEVTEQ